MKLVLAFLGSVFFSLNVFADRNLAVIEASDIVCESEYNLFSLEINSSRGTVVVFDNLQGRVSHTLLGLEKSQVGSVIQLINNDDRNLPEGVVFEVDFEKSGYNAYSVDDHGFNPKTTRYDCRKID
jgi:hypothetical protein